jgi:glycosyltransferase involved in cell wall biosynthesis
MDPFMKILAFPRYDFTQASTRVRILQYLPFLEKAGIDIEIFPILDFNGISGNSIKLTFWKSRVMSYLKVGKRLIKEKNKNTLIHLHSELFPFIPFWIEYGFLSLFGKKKFIIELDDAWFHRYDNHKSIFVRIFLGKKINLLMRNSVLVIAGNQYIADRARISGAKRIEIIPTVVDVEKYKKYNLTSEYKKINSDAFLMNKPKVSPIIGWIGSHATTKFLIAIKDVIKFLHDSGEARFVAIGADSSLISDLPIKVIQWREQIEIETLYHFDIGIMPLTDSLFERGKCGYKLIQYMACALPLVASPVGVNNSIVIHKETGYLATTNEEWIKYLTLLCRDESLRKRLGRKGQIRADMFYSLRVNAPKLVSLLKDTLKY